MSEDRPLKGNRQSSGFGIYEEDLHQDIDALADQMQALGPDILEAIAHAQTMTPEDVEETIDYILNEHGKDLIFPPRVIEAAKHYRFDEKLKDNPAEYQKTYEKLKVEAALLAINSPYPEVRAAIDNHDDPTMPASTFRSWFIGTVFTVAGAFINEFFSPRLPSILVTVYVAQLLAFPVGKLLEAILPTWQFTTFGYMWSLNPGKFNRKEHMVVAIMTRVGFFTPYTDSIISVQYPPIYFNQPWASNFGYQITVALSTNFIGYGLAGLTRRFLVYPSQAVWPINLATVAFMHAFHTESNDVVNSWAISRIRWFMYCFTAMFIYFWFPGYILQAMSYFNWITWISPSNVKLAAIVGSVNGLGFNPLPTFDWVQIVQFYDPLVNPFFSTMNYFLGALFTFPIIAAIWFTNTWYTGHLPINSVHVFDNTGQNYKIALAVNNKALFDEASYKAYSPIYLSAGRLLNHCAFFGVYTSIITHSALYYRHEIVSGCKNMVTHKPAFANSRDVHTRLMRSYKEVPEWAYLIILCASVGIGAAGIATYPTNTSPAAALYGVLLATTFCIPCGVIMATTNVEIPLNIISELFGGLWFPGNATAMLYFKSYGTTTTSRALHFAQDLKLAHYTHIPPWVTFNCQIFATLVSTFTCTITLNRVITTIPDFCTPNQKDHFTCPGTNIFFTASVLWGTLGPKKMFGIGAIYNKLLWGFLIGALLPIPFYFLSRKWRVFLYFHSPVLLYGATTWSPLNLSHVWPTVPVAWLFNCYIKKRYFGWWSKYNYVTTSAFSCGVVISALVIFFALQQQGIRIDWIGNTRPFDGCDGSGCVLYPVPKGGHFGPGPGEF